jgi:hypothetical protein
MSIINQHDDIFFIIMSFLDVKSIFRFGQCLQKFYLLSLDERLWVIKLESDYKRVKYEETSSSEAYKWCVIVASISDPFWNRLHFKFPEECKSYVVETIKVLGPRGFDDFDETWEELQSGPYYLPVIIKSNLQKILMPAISTKMN